MKKRLSLFLVIGLMFGLTLLIASPVKAQEPVECEIVETDWEKTTNSDVENTFEGADLLLG